MIYRLGQAWFGLPPEQAALWLRIHQGAYLGPFLKPFYVLLLGGWVTHDVDHGIQDASSVSTATELTSESAPFDV